MAPRTARGRRRSSRAPRRRAPRTAGRPWARRPRRGARRRPSARLRERARRHAQRREHGPVHPRAERLAGDELGPVLGDGEAAAGVAEAAAGRGREPHRPRVPLAGEQPRRVGDRGARLDAGVGGDREPGRVAQHAPQRDPVLHALGRARRTPASERGDERRVEVPGVGPPTAAARRPRRAPSTPSRPGTARRRPPRRPRRSRRRRPRAPRAPPPARSPGRGRRARRVRRAPLLAGLAFLAVTRGLDRARGRRERDATVGPSIRDAPSVRR